MAKGMYMFIAYKESCDFQGLLDNLGVMGAEYAYILHDKDVWEKDTEVNGTLHKAGEPKKAHYHILAGWVNHFPDWKTFKTMVRTYGAVAPSKKECLVRDPYRAYSYLTHEPGTGESDETPV